MKRHLTTWGWSLAAGVGAWLLVMLGGSGCIQPSPSDPTTFYWEPRYGCFFSTVMPYWVIGVLAGLLALNLALNHFYRQDA